MMTTTDKTLRELNIIDVIFKSQFKKQSERERFKEPALLTPDGERAVDGSVLIRFDIYSDEELFNVHLFKREIENRYESAINKALLMNQLDKIYKKALSVVEYASAQLPPTEREYYSKNLIKSGVIEILRGSVKTVFFDCDRSTVDFNLLVETLDDVTIYEPTHSYYSNNFALAGFCQSLIDFIDELNILSEENIELKGICLFLRNRSRFIAPAKNDTLKWNAVLKEFGFDGKFTASSIGKTYNDINQTKNDVVSPITDKNYKQAESLFAKFPDPEGLKNLLLERK